jgi:serine/threonine-protein kinase
MGSAGNEGDDGSAMSSNPPPDRGSATRHQPARFPTGHLLAGRYEILDRIGEGGTAEVFRARDQRLDRTVAVKVLRPQYGQDPDARARFSVEARSTAALAASNIVPVYDFGAADDGSLYIVMRYIDGPSLRSVLAERGSLPPAEAIELGREVAYALAAAHEHGLVHRDVKPGNILLDSAGTAHLTDFGIVKALAGADDLTRTGVAFGTAAYLSPEQATGGSVDARTDLYALGVVLYEALAGRPPFSGEDPITVSYRHAHDTPTPLSTLVPGIDADLERVVMQSLEKDPDRRPASAEEVAASLGSIGARLRSSSLGAATLAALAGEAAIRADVGGAETRPEEAAESETVVMASAPSQAAPAGWSAGTAPTFASLWSRDAGTPPPTNAGVVPAPRPVRASRDDRRGGSALGPAILVLAIALVAVLAAVVVLPALLPRGDDGAVANASPTFRSSPTPVPSVPVIVPPIATGTATPTLVAVVTSPPIVVVPSVTPAAPSPSDPPTAPPPTAPLSPSPSDPPTAPPPTAPLSPSPSDPPTAPPTASPTSPPPVGAISARIENELFLGDYDQGSGVYHGRTASWVYGQGTPYHTMTASFQLGHQGLVVGNASLELVGLDAENPIKQPIRIVLNGVTIYEGPNPLPDDTCCGPQGPGNWGSAFFEFSGALVQSDNTLVITNLAASDCTECSKYVMVDYGVLSYTVQP